VSVLFYKYFYGNVHFFSVFHAAFIKGDLKNKLKKGKLSLNNSKIGNSITGNHQANRIEAEYLKHRYDDDNYR